MRQVQRVFRKDRLRDESQKQDFPPLLLPMHGLRQGVHSGGAIRNELLSNILPGNVQNCL